MSTTARTARDGVLAALISGDWDLALRLSLDHADQLHRRADVRAVRRELVARLCGLAARGAADKAATQVRARAITIPLRTRRAEARS